MLLGILLSLLLDPTGKYQALVPLGVGEGIGGGKRLPAAGIWGEIAARLSEMENFPAQPRGRGSISTWVGGPRLVGDADRGHRVPQGSQEI